MYATDARGEQYRVSLRHTHTHSLSQFCTVECTKLRETAIQKSYEKKMRYSKLPARRTRGNWKGSPFTWTPQENLKNFAK